MSATETQSFAGEGVPRLKDRSAPWRWLSAAAGIYRRQLVLSAGYGLLFTLLGYGILAALMARGAVAAMPVAVGAFALMGPLMAAGLYAIARADEAGRVAKPAEVLRPRAASPTQIAYLGVILLVAVFFWVVIAAALFAMFQAGGLSSLREFAAFALTTPRGLAMTVIGSFLGGLIAYTIFAVSAFSIPILMDRETDFATAIIASVTTVLEEPRPMLLWAWLIALSVAIGAVTLLVGFVYLFPLLGYATWVGYRETFGASSPSS